MPRIEFQSARTDEREAEAAAEALIGALAGAAPRLVTIFAGDAHDHPALNRAVRRRLPAATRLVGATSGGEIDRDGMHRGTVVLGALSGDFEVGLGLGTGLSRDAIAAGGAALVRACQDLGVVPADLDRGRNVGLVIDDGLRGKKEELLMGALADHPEVTLVGGGATGYDPTAGAPGALVHLDDEVATDAVLLALFSLDVPFAAMRSHWYLPTGDRVTVTRVDASCTRALEIDGRPAAARYAELVGVPAGELGFAGLGGRGFDERPTAVRMGREYVLRAPYQALPDGSILFANLVEEGMQLEVMRMGDPVEMTRRFLAEEIPARVPDPAAALFFHCGARSLMARQRGIDGELSRALADAPPCAGMDVFFEIYNGLHVNTTLTALVIGAGSQP